MRTLLFILLLILSSCLGIQLPVTPPDQGSEPPSVPPGQPYVRQDITIKQAQIAGLAGQLALSVRGFIPDGCMAPVNVEIATSDQTITVDIFRMLPADAVCPQVVTAYIELIDLPPTIGPGTYTVRVNDVVFEATVPESGVPPVDRRPTLGPPQLDVTPIPKPDGDALLRSDPIIMDVQVMVLESYPMQLVLTVTGQFRDGCTLPVQVEQQRDGNTVTVALYRLKAADMLCPDVMQPFEQTVRLEGGFESGTYTIRVNDFTTTITL